MSRQPKTDRKASLAKLQSSTAAYLRKWKADGKPTRTYTAPCCHAQQETTVPSHRDEVWDSLTVCTNCGGMFMKIARAGGVRTRLPEPVRP